MTRTTVGVSILVSSLAAAAFAQGPGLERVFPQSYLTQPHPESITTPDPKMASILYYQVHIAQPNATLDPSVPEEAAQMYMAKLRAELTAGRLTPDTINLWLHGWGNDDARSDPDWVDPDPADPELFPYVQQTRFFCEDDRLVGVLDSNFPTPPTVGDDNSARAYRQPFLLNATREGPLAAWMEDFCAYIGEHYDDPQYNLPHPGTWKWWFDVEAWIATWFGGPNPVYMLSQIASNPNIWGTSDPNNRGWPVPGSPGWVAPTDWPRNGTARDWAAEMPNQPDDGLSFYEMYEAMRAAQLAAGVAQWPVDINHTTLGIDPDLRGDDDRNRKFMAWALQITYHAQDAVLKTSAYDIIRAHFDPDGDGPIEVVCSNYEYSNFDGAEDWTGWYLDLGNANQPSNRFPRVWLDRNTSTALMAKENVLGPTLHDRWVGTRQKTSASMNSPVLYPLQYLQLAGYPGAPSYKGHAQANLYLPPTLACYDCNSDCTYSHVPPNPAQCDGWAGCVPPKSRSSVNDPWECLLDSCGRCGWDASLRMDRLAIESVINSTVNGVPGMHFDDLAIWLMQFVRGDIGGLNYYALEDPLRATIAMLRGKNVPVFLFFTGAYQANGFSLEAWQSTQSLVRRVYAAEVFRIKSVYGDVPDGFDAHEPTMLEYTLRDATGEDYVSSVRGEFSFNEVENVWEMLAGIEVFFDLRLKDIYGSSQWPQEYLDLSAGAYKYEINVESVGDAENLGIIERVLAWDYTAEEWVYVPTREGELTHGFNTPDGTSRRTFMLPLYDNRCFTEAWQEDDPDSEDPNQTRTVNRMQIRVVHKGPMYIGSWPNPQQHPGWHHSEFDLVQVIPIPVPTPSQEEAEGLAVGDLNFDGIVGESDLDMFATAWLDGKPLADLNIDEVVDDFDLEAFIESFYQQP